jgi:asparagine synthetase B (glutamine-hydrolysing)
MIGFCKKRFQKTVDLREIFPAQENNGEKRFLWLGNERDNQTMVLSSRLGTFFTEFGPFLALMQGYCHPGEPATPESNERFLIDFLRQYRSTGDFQTPTADGCYTILLVDGVKGKTFLYRNLVGSTLTYYTLTDEGFFWGNNFAQIVRTRRNAKSLDETMLPVLFLGRYPTGNKTLVQDVYRLSPGELVVFDGESVRAEQVTTFRDLEEPGKTNEAESIERVEAVTAKILQDLGNLYPNSANLLSGGIDSTWLQVQWNNWWHTANPFGQDEQPRSAVVWLDHPRTRLDLEYSQSAALATGTFNLSIEQPLLTPEFLSQIIARNGEFPNHVQSVYFDTLAKGMREHGIDAGIIGEGADGQIGRAHV